MTDIDLPALDRELKKGVAELPRLSVLDARPRHGDERRRPFVTVDGHGSACVVATAADLG
jgi:hypothetical protein